MKKHFILLAGLSFCQIQAMHYCDGHHGKSTQNTTLRSDPRYAMAGPSPKYMGKSLVELAALKYLKNFGENKENLKSFSSLQGDYKDIVKQAIINIPQTSTKLNAFKKADKDAYITIETEHNIVTARFTQDGKHIFIATHNGDILLYDLLGIVCKRIKVRGNDLNFADISPSKNLIVTTQGKKSYLWNWDNDMLAEYKHASDPNLLVRLFSSSLDKKVKFIDNKSIVTIEHFSVPAIGEDDSTDYGVNLRYWDLAGSEIENPFYNMENPFRRPEKEYSRKDVQEKGDISDRVSITNSADGNYAIEFHKYKRTIIRVYELNLTRENKRLEEFSPEQILFLFFSQLRQEPKDESCIIG